MKATVVKLDLGIADGKPEATSRGQEDKKKLSW